MFLEDAYIFMRLYNVTVEGRKAMEPSPYNNKEEL